jgi:hypothetical protein
MIVPKRRRRTKNAGRRKRRKKKMTYSETCPNCGCEDYEVNDYGDSFDQFGGGQWWSCTCDKCGCKFDMTKIYKLSNVIIEEVSES